MKPASKSAARVQNGRPRRCGSQSHACRDGSRKISANGFVAMTSSATTPRASNAAAVPASSSDGETGRRGSSRSRVTNQPMPLSNASPTRPTTGQLLAGELSGGSGTAGALGQTPTSANSSKIATVQSQK